MYEFHGWLQLAETPSESDVGGLDAAIAHLQPVVARFRWPLSTAEIHVFNGMSVLWVHGMTNRPRDEADALDDLLAFVGARLPGSYGIVYDRDDEPSKILPDNAFRVRVLARGTVSQPSDSFLSPCRPRIED